MTPRAMSGLLLRSLLGALWFGLWFFVAIPAGVLYLTGTSFRLPGAASLWLGIAIIAAAHVVMVAEVIAFARAGRGTHMPFDPPTALVAGGFFQRVRNPMYLAYVTVAVGEAIGFRSAWLAGYAVVLACVAHVYVLRVEEPALRERFGAEYERYCERTGRWLPRLR